MVTIILVPLICIYFRLSANELHLHGDFYRGEHDEEMYVPK